MGARPEIDDVVLSVRGLRTQVKTGSGLLTAVDGVDFEVRRGEILALLGESGCGKSLTALSLMGLVRASDGEVTGSVVLGERDLLAQGDAALRRIRGADMAMIFQEPMSALNPVLTVGSQVAEVLAHHRGVTGAAARERVVTLFREVGIVSPAARYDNYPHELSGGTCQRVLIAMALACDPQLLIADEPTTALDVTVQQQILDLLHSLRSRTGMAVLLITHDLGVVAENADRVAVMYLGRIVEQAPVDQLFAAPAHPYTRGLLAALPELGTAGMPLYAIPGSVPDLRNRPAGCGFAPRCPLADDHCRAQDPGLALLAPGHAVRCWKPFTEVAA